MKLAFAFLSVLTLTSAITAMRLRNLVHSVLCLAVTLAGLGGFYLLLNAEFVAFAQILVYVGAVTILVVFAILLTKGAEPEPGIAIFSATWFKGIAVAILAAGSLILCVMTTPSVRRSLPEIPKMPTAEYRELQAKSGLALLDRPQTTVKTIGDQLMTTHILTMEVIGLLLTAALIGAIIIAMPERKGTPSNDEYPAKN